MYNFKHKKLRMVMVMISMTFIQDLQHLMTPILSQVQSQFPGVSVSWIQLLVTGASFFAVFISLISGGLVFWFSKKQLLLFSGLITGVTGILPLVTTSYEMLLMSRILFGVGMGISSALNVAIVADYFEGDERIWAMGIQSASVGIGMIIITFLSGIIGRNHFRNSFFLHIIGFLAILVVAVCLPETEKKQKKESGKIRLPREVFVLGLFGFFMFLFLASFSTNIAMHIEGTYSGDSAITGVITGIFAAAQVVLGFFLGRVVKVTKQYTLMAAMGFFVIGVVLLELFPGQLPGLFIGAAFCGATQGLFIPTAMVNVSNITQGESTVVASAIFNCFVCLGQAISPGVLNFSSGFLFGTVSTSRVFLIAAAGMTVVAVLQGIHVRKGTAFQNG